MTRRRNYTRCHVDLDLAGGVSLSMSGSSQWIQREMPKLLRILKESGL